MTGICPNARTNLAKAHRGGQSLELLGPCECAGPPFTHSVSFYTVFLFPDEDTKRRIPFAFLEDIKQQFVLGCGEAASKAIAFSLNETFGPVLKKQMVCFIFSQRLAIVEHT